MLTIYTKICIPNFDLLYEEKSKIIIDTYMQLNHYSTSNYPAMLQVIYDHYPTSVKLPCYVPAYL